MLSFSLVFNNTKPKYIKEKSEKYFNIKFHKHKDIFDAIQFEENLSLSLYNANLHFSIITKEENEIRRALRNISRFIIEFFQNKTIGIHYYQNDLNIRFDDMSNLKLIDF